MRFANTSASVAQEETVAKKEAATAPERQSTKDITSYWGIPPTKLVKEDGTEWKWSCFKV